jgi:hypothetical protein
LRTDLFHREPGHDARLTKVCRARDRPHTSGPARRRLFADVPAATGCGGDDGGPGGTVGHVGLQLHEDEMRLIEFGRFAEENRRRKGSARTEEFDFWALRTIAVSPGTSAFYSAKRLGESG